MVTIMNIDPYSLIKQSLTTVLENTIVNLNPQVTIVYR